MKKNYNKGFTLIELLVVIAIIGILASVILASLNSARAKAADTASKADFSSARTQAELYYSGSNDSYNNVCVALLTAIPGGINDMMTDVAAKSGAIFDGVLANDGTGKTECHNSINPNSAWAASFPLKAVAGSYFCMDSTGAAKQGATEIVGANATTCP